MTRELYRKARWLETGMLVLIVLLPVLLGLLAALGDHPHLAGPIRRMAFK